MFPEDQGPAEAAIAYTDQFVEAGVAKLDALFGAGYAKANPAALQAYVAGCIGTLDAFMNAAATAAALDDDAAFDEALAAFEEEYPPEPEPKPKGRRR